jgi:peptidoglycan/xylan/chitin deacetylase (PgdA/CDA1 family)
MRRVSYLQLKLLRTAAGIVSRWGDRALLIVTYHRVLLQPDPLLPDEPSAEEFSTLIDALRRTFNVLGLHEALTLMKARRLPARALCITFDDGYANNSEVALPILREHGVRATFFIATGFLNGGRMWNDSIIEAVRNAPAGLDLEDLGLGKYALLDMQARRGAIAQLLGSLKYTEPGARARISALVAERAGVTPTSDLMMSDEQVRKLTRGGMDVGGHTVNHPILARLDGDIARREINESHDRLKQITGNTPLSFAYPNGRPGVDYGPEHVAMVREAGFECAVSTASGCATALTDAYQLPRIAPWGASAGAYILRAQRCYLDRQ